MDLAFSPEEERFRQRVRSFLRDNLPPNWGTAEQKLPEGMSQVEFLRDWQRRLYLNGLLGMSWPKEYGGQGASRTEMAIFNEEMARHRAPGPLNALGLSMAGPTIITHGTEEQKQRFLRKILTCEEVWCQGFSEPNAGSDVASLRTRAELRGDEFVVNGQKVWTSLAHIADWCMLLVRTDPQAPKHRGLSYLLVDMHSPGVTVKPLRQITGESEFNEVFFEDVRVPRANLLGGLNEGWRVAMTTLTNERGTAAFALAARFRIVFDEIAELAHQTIRNGAPVTGDPLVRQQLAQFYVELEMMKYTSYRVFSKILKGGDPGPEGSISKLSWSELNQRMTEFAMALEGPASQLVKGSPYALQSGRWQHHFLRARANTIEAGTSEIQRNIIAERVLRMPRGR
ncbi:MAG TPA: acyl-CoA dehydrogenase [Candidatus Binataceae bacterium]|jgi:alkylation response protein AidB-like acyl-CoA dehydrogenase|nr:acyl-CoA dehydrogenase [Candidatus Binataceae bacterium]